MSKLKGLKKLVGSLSKADKAELAKSMKDGATVKMAGGGAVPKSGVVKVGMGGAPKAGVKKMKVGGEVVSIVQIKVTGKDKFTIAYLDWDNGKRPLLTRKIHKNVSGKNLPKELKRNVKVG